MFIAIVFFYSVIRTLKAPLAETALFSCSGDFGMKQCYYINTIALLTPGSYFLRCNPWSFRDLIYSNWSGVDVRLSHFISPLHAPSLLSLRLLPTLQIYTGFSSNFRTISLLTCPGVDFHLDHWHSCLSMWCPEAWCSALLKSVNIYIKERGKGVRNAHTYTHMQKTRNMAETVNIHLFNLYMRRCSCTLAEAEVCLFEL